MNGWVLLFVFFCCFHQLLNRDAWSPLPLGNDEVFKPNRTLQTLLIPEATNRKTTYLTEVTLEDITRVVAQVAEPGVC